jgi:glutamyl-Q tRNA(Asp) synthetase
MTTVTRFAPSPTGLLHLGHAYSALFAWQRAREAGGRFLLRIEDIDRGRCRPEFETAIMSDLAWLGIEWGGVARRQSDHYEDYRRALDRLEAEGLIYPCFCTRKDIRREAAAIGGAPHGPDGPAYPGTCRALPADARAERIASGVAFALRLDVAEAVRRTGPLVWRDHAHGPIVADPARFGDVILARKDTPTSYHLAVTVDDALQGVTLVTRGADLLPATDIHRLLQALLDLPVPEYHHHRLLGGPDGRRYAKRDRALTIRALREAGHSPSEVVALTELEPEANR